MLELWNIRSMCLILDGDDNTHFVTIKLDQNAVEKNFGKHTIEIYPA